MKRCVAGFSLVEFVIAVVFVGVVLGPMLVYVARLNELNGALGRQGGQEAWRSFQDQAVAAGIVPAAAPALQPDGNAAIPKLVPMAVVEQPADAPAGSPRLVPLRATTDPGVPEPRIAAAGYQIGAGIGLPPRGNPRVPLLPIVMPLPAVTPGNGAVIAVASLSGGSDAEPAHAIVQAAADAGARVRLVLNRPAVASEGRGQAEQSVRAPDLLAGVSGLAWTEYPGDSAAGDRSLVLTDGRIRWLVTRSDRRLQIYEPSPAVRFAYRLSLGAPVLVQSGMPDTASGASLAFDHRAVTAVAAGSRSVQIDYPTAVKAAFGRDWPTAAVGFQCTFAGAPGPFSGDLAGFFQPGALAQWSDANVVEAVPVLPAGGVIEPASWTLCRLTTPLGVPQLATATPRAGVFGVGRVEFVVPTPPGATGPVGRLSFENGSAISTGVSLSLALMP